EVIAIPTDTVYGLVGLEPARDRIFALKHRPPELELPVLVADVEQAGTIGIILPLARTLMDQWWPGGLTVVVEAIAGGTVGVRVPNHDVPRALAREVGPLLSTSANPHGASPCTTAAEVRSVFPEVLLI